MNWRNVADHWMTLRGKVQERWTRLSDADLDSVAGSRSRLLRALQDHYGLHIEQADALLLEWQKDLDNDTPTLVLWEPMRRTSAH